MLSFELLKTAVLPKLKKCEEAGRGSKFWAFSDNVTINVPHHIFTTKKLESIDSDEAIQLEATNYAISVG